MMTDILPSVLEAIKLQFNQPKTMHLEDTYNFQLDGLIKYDASILYEIIGGYLENDRIKVVTNIYKLRCIEFVASFAMASFEKKVKSEIARKIPESENHVDIICLIKKMNDGDERQRRKDLQR